MNYPQGDSPIEVGELMHVPKLSHVLADRLRGRIVTGQLRAGDKLPPEGELIEVFKVSRPTLREALRILEAEGLLQVGRGMRTGATVCSPSMDRAAEYAAMVLSSSGATMAEIHEARAALEPSLASRLVHTHNRGVVRELREASDAQMAALQSKDYDAALRAVNQFHAVLVRSSGNPVLVLLVGMLHTLSASTSAFLVEGSAANSEDLPRNLAKTASGHARLVELIEAGRAKEAEKFWAEYMGRAQEFLKRTRLGTRRLQHDGKRS